MDALLLGANVDEVAMYETVIHMTMAIGGMLLIIIAVLFIVDKVGK